MWKIKIEKIENGYILSYEVEAEENKFVKVKEAFEEDDDEKETMSRLLGRVADYFGFHYDKFAKDNLRISWDRKGRDLE